MNRRSFLKLFGVSAAATALPVFALEALGVLSLESSHRWEEFDSTQTYGDYILISEDWDSLGRDQKFKLLKVVETSMREFIPPDKWDKVTYICHGLGSSGAVDPYQECSSVAWAYKP